MAQAEDNQGHRATLRVLAILDTLASSERGLTMAEICRELDAPKSSLFPILHTMADTEYIVYDENTSRYSVGLKTYLLGRAFDQDEHGLPLIKSAMREVVNTCGETCQLGMLDNGRVLYVAKIDSPQRIRLSSEIGKTLPANCTAIGKAILSSWEDDEVLELFPGPLERPTERAAATVEELMEELAEVRNTGFSHDRQEVLEGVECIAIPIYQHGDVRFGMGVSVPAYRLTEEKERLVEQTLTRARDQLETALA
jgi:IclR family transcriptional regulator, KDG regulon repressor